MALIDEDAALALPCRGKNNHDKDNREKVLTECGGKSRHVEITNLEAINWRKRNRKLQK